MERTDKQKEQLLKDLWYSRNPCHDNDQEGNDRFWGTVLCVFEDYKLALTLPDVVEPFFCNNEKVGVRCTTQCLGCDGFERSE